MNDLADALAHIERLASLPSRGEPRPVDEAALRAVAEELAVALSPDVAELFRWRARHDEVGRLHADWDVELMELSHALETRRFLLDEAEGFDATWLPVLDNGAGDYLCVSLDDGAVRSYSHEGLPSALVWPSLLAWANDVVSSWPRRRPPNPFAALRSAPITVECRVVRPPPRWPDVELLRSVRALTGEPLAAITAAFKEPTRALVRRDLATHPEGVLGKVRWLKELGVVAELLGEHGATVGLTLVEPAGSRSLSLEDLRALWDALL